MSAPAGWYDDGSGRQRWWDGAQWTEHYAPIGATASAPTAQTAAAWPSSTAVHSAPASRTPVLGIVGLGAAVLGTILVIIPVVVTVAVGAVLLLAALVVSIIALFAKGTRKWPAIVGVVLSVVGGIIGAIVFAGMLFATYVADTVEDLPTAAPPSTPGAAPSDEPHDDTTGERPSPEQIADGYLELMEGQVGLDEYMTPEFADCAGQYFYDSDLSDELLQKVADGVVITEENAGDELALLESEILAAGAECSAP